ncbi:MAG: threonine/serine exporter ThrE family protein [Anaeroplasmataceae bacterium]
MKEEALKLEPHQFNSWKKVLDYAMLIAKKMISCGAEIQRVEGTVKYICNAYGAKKVDVFAIPSMLMATVESDDLYYTTKVKIVKNVSNNFLLLERLNSLSRYICEHKPSIEEIEDLIKDVDQYKKPKYTWLPIVGTTLGGSILSVYFGGTFRDFLACLIVTLIMSLIIYFQKRVVNQFISTFLLALIGGLFSVLVCKIGIGQNVNYVMIGCIMILIPGIMLSIAFKDLFTGDLLSGVLRIVSSLITALMIALGFSVSLNIIKTEFYSSTNPIWLQILSCAVGTLAFSLVYNNNFKHLVAILVAATLGVAIYLLMDKYVTHNEFLKALAGSSCVSLCAIIYSRMFKAPSTCFLIPSLIPLAPGCFLYKTMYYLTSGSYSLMKENLINTIYVAVGIGLGIIIIVVLENYLGSFLKNRIQKKPLNHQS